MWPVCLRRRAGDCPDVRRAGPDTIHAMNPAALYFASGESLYPGAALLLLLIEYRCF